MGKKRASDAAALPSRPSKKRKSAEASKAKIKEIVEAEEVEPADEFMETVELKAQVTIGVDGDGDGEDGEDVKKEDEEKVEVIPRVVEPGFRKWETTSRMTAGGLITEMPSFDASTQEYSLVVDVRSKEAFALKPLVITHGLYSGSYVFMLERTTKGFRLLDLPPEIRNHIYSFLVKEDEPIKIQSLKPVNEPRRPIRNTFWDVRSGLTRHRRTWKWIGQSPSSFAILGASKQLFDEVAPIMYGDNHFHFSDLVPAKVFMDTIDSMRKYVRHVHIGANAYSRSKVRSTFSSMKGAINLRSLFLDTSLIRSGPMLNYYSRYYAATVDEMATYLRPLLSVIRMNRRASGDDFNILDLMKIDWTRCSKCKELAPNFATDLVCANCSMYPTKKCKDGARHAQQVEKKLRKAIAQTLGIKELRSDEAEEDSEAPASEADST